MMCPHWWRKRWSPCTPACAGSPSLLLAHLPHRRESLVSGRRITGREAIACDAVGVLDAVAAAGTLVRRGRRHTPSTCSAAGKPARSSDHARDAGRAVPGRPPRAAARCERGRARRSRLDLRTAQLGNEALYRRYTAIQHSSAVTSPPSVPPRQPVSTFRLCCL